MWANNHASDAGDSVEDIRRFRAGDRALSDTRFKQPAHATADPRSEEQIADDLVAILGLEA